MASNHIPAGVSSAEGTGEPVPMFQGSNSVSFSSTAFPAIFIHQLAKPIYATLDFEG